MRTTLHPYSAHLGGHGRCLQSARNGPQMDLLMGAQWFWAVMDTVVFWSAVFVVVYVSTDGGQKLESSFKIFPWPKSDGLTR
jgi:hypothetical protein